MKDQECKICQKKCISNKGLGLHLFAHKITPKEYYDKYYKRESDGICLTCGKKTKWNNHKRCYYLFCCIKCVNQNSIVRNKIYTTNIKRYNAKHPLQNKIISNKVKQTCIKKYGVDNPTKNKLILQKSFATHKRNTGYNVWTQIPKNKQKLREKWHGRHGIGKNEKYILDQQEIKDHCNIDRNFSVIGYYPDGYCHKSNTIYEVLELHHFKPSNIKKDKKRLNAIIKVLKCNVVLIADVKY